MGHKDQDKRKELIREEVFKFIAQNAGDLGTLKERLLRVVSSRTKIKNAIDELVQSGRLVIKGKNIEVSQDVVLTGTFYSSSGKKSVVIEGQSQRYELSRKDDNLSYNNGQKVKVAFCDYNGRLSPIILGSASSSEKDNLVTNEGAELIYGRVMKSDHDNLVFIPNDKRRFRHNIVIVNDKKNQSSFQDKICTLRLISEEKNGQQAYGFIEEIVGEAGNPVSEYDAIAKSHGAIMSWADKAVASEIEKAPTEVNLENTHLISEEESEIDKGGKVDLRNLMFTTTDPATCKDMDDAIYSTFDKSGNLVVYTAVASVSKYINLKSEIGKRYIQGAFTTYAPNKAYNILPPAYSTNICSLNPNVDRLALVIKTTVDPNSGKPIKSQIMDSVICSKGKYSYEQAQEIVDNNDISLDYLKGKIDKGENLTKDEQVVMNFYASKILGRGFKKRNMIEFDTKNEYEVKFNEDLSDIEDIVLEQNIPYHKVIENFMITANEAAAEYALKNHLPNIYRVHDEPNEDKLAQASEFFQYLNIPYDGDLSPDGIKGMLAYVKDTPQEKIVNEFLVRMQSKATYSISPDPKESGFISQRAQKRGKKFQGKIDKDFKDELDELDRQISHFGLQSEHYSHTTSPIRRLPDYITHYNILAHLSGDAPLDESIVNDLASWANIMQDQNDLAEREFKELNSAIYCEHHIGDVMRGKICAFRKIENGLGGEDISVIIENEEKGIKVSVPLSEVLAVTGKSKTNATISQFGSAIISKDSKRALLTLCSEIPFKILSANRISREVFATTDLTREKDGYSSVVVEEGRAKSNSRRYRMAENTTFKKEEERKAILREDEDRSKGQKLLNNHQDYKKYRLEADEAYGANRINGIIYRNNKIKAQEKELKDFVLDDDEKD